MSLILRELQEKDESAFIEAINDWPSEDRRWISFEPTDNLNYTELLKKLESQKYKENLPSDYVPASMLYGFVGDKIVGRVSVRHELNEKLLIDGGNIGYAVSPKYRQNGYASIMLKLALDFCRQLGLKRALLTCLDTNIASIKVIEKNGGVYESTGISHISNLPTRRYWIEL